MSDKVVYRSTHPEVLAAWEAKKQKMTDVYEQRRKLLDELGFEGRPALITDTQIHGVQFAGADIPAGWRADYQFGNAIIPNKRTKIGKQIAKRFEELHTPNPRALVGMPGTDVELGRWAECGLREMDGALFVTWPRPIDEKRIDLDRWERVKLSEFYATVEAHEAAQAENGGGS
ncbi:hypothetical protein [Nonomuraea typhae]|uniref:Uncharacterized protein n=1 Tax=Nonomuraea typhae TaxID=2603600 RepID=A0ABW7YLS2_9ACTN